MAVTDNILLAFYGDDFTGSTDALEFLTRAGARTVLFLAPPTAEQLARFGRLDAVGIAGMTRAMPPDEISRSLPPALRALQRLNPRHIHYKVCSTFDSSPETGNIGTAIATGQALFKHRFTPVLVAAPHLGRYSAFGNLYARMGTGSQGTIYRLDRHPSMSNHPVTPAHESDLRLHLARQTDANMGLIDLIDLTLSTEEIRKKLDAMIAGGMGIVFFDAIYEHQMGKIGEVLDGYAHEQVPFFSVGSSGIEKALGDFWTSQGDLSRQPAWESLSASAPMLVLTGSVSPVTARQIEWAAANGFEVIAVESGVLKGGEEEKKGIKKYQALVAAALGDGRNVVLHTAKGPHDRRLQETKALFAGHGWDEALVRRETAIRLGRVLGQAARGALAAVPVKRLVIAGGDTSGYVARALGIEAVAMIAPIVTGAPLCRAYAPGSPVDGMEVNLKGGQVGDDTYFGVLQKGGDGATMN